MRAPSPSGVGEVQADEAVDMLVVGSLICVEGR